MYKRQHAFLSKTRSAALQLPDQLDGLVSLKHLVVSDNPFAGFPIALCSLPSLAVLRCNSCGSATAQTTLPDAFGNLSNLEIFEADNSGISGLPESVSKLTKLTRLSMKNNALTQVSKGLRSTARFACILLPLSLSSAMLC